MKKIRYGLTGGVVLVILVCAVYGVRKIRPAGPVAVLASDQKIKGPVSAPIQIVEYSDFQCPACQRASLTVKELFSNPEYDGKVRIIFRHFPLPGHRWAGLAHQAAECANQQGKFWEMHDRLYAEQAAWSVLNDPIETFFRYAKDLNLPLETFGACLTDAKVRDEVLDDKRKGENLRVNSTPTFFINGERYVGPVEFQTKGIEVIRKTLGLPTPVPSPSPSAS